MDAADSPFGSAPREPGSAALLDVEASEVVRTIELEGYTRPHGIVFLDDRHVLVTVEENRAVIKVDVVDGEVVQEIGTDAEVSHMLAVSKKQGLAFVASMGSGSVTIIDLALGARLASVPTGEGAEGIAVTPDGRQVWVTNRAEDTITVVTPRITSARQALFTDSRRGPPPVLGDQRQGNDLSVYSTDDFSEVRRVDFDAVSKDAEGRLFGDRFGTSSVPIGIEIVDEEQRAYIAHANADGISIIDLGEWKIIGTLSAGKEPDGMGYSPLAPKHDE